ncbi:hypothetical protein DD630_24680 [Streptomyces sp. BSE7F]|nr:hypothetical protein DD630_24680 [Streptomyces sp. BSE7F]
MRRDASSADPSGVWCVQLQGGGGRQRGALATDDNAAGGTPTPVQGSGGVRARPRDAGVIQTKGPSGQGVGPGRCSAPAGADVFPESAGEGF